MICFCLHASFKSIEIFFCFPVLFAPLTYVFSWTTYFALPCPMTYGRCACKCRWAPYTSLHQMISREISPLFQWWSIDICSCNHQAITWPNINADECYQVHNLKYDNKLSNFQWVEMPWRPCDVRVMCIHWMRVKSMAICRNSYLWSTGRFLENHIAWHLLIVLTITITYTVDLRQPNTDDADKPQLNITKSFSLQVPVPLYIQP